MEVLDYFQLVRGYFTRVDTMFWACVNSLPDHIVQHTPSWFFYLIYFYLVIALHMVLIIMIYRIIADTFVYEPQMALERAKKVQESQR